MCTPGGKVEMYVQVCTRNVSNCSRFLAQLSSTKSDLNFVLRSKSLRTRKKSSSILYVKSWLIRTHNTHSCIFFMKAVIIISIYVSQGMRFWVRRFCGYLSATIQPLPILRMFSVHISALAECTKCTTSKIGINANCQNLREANL